MNILYRVFDLSTGKYIGKCYSNKQAAFNLVKKLNRDNLVVAKLQYHVLEVYDINENICNIQC